MMLGLAGSGRSPSSLAEKAGRADDLLRSCVLCEHRCRVARSGSERGQCGCDSRARAFQEGLLWGEEEFITPTYALFFAGCNLRCSFCYVAESNEHVEGHEVVDIAAVAARVRECDPPPVSFSFIGGEPTVHLPTALRLISALRQAQGRPERGRGAALPAELPVVWNSNFYFTPEAAEVLAGSVEVFIADLHFGNDACAHRVAGAPRYLETVLRNLEWAKEVGTLVVRQLVLPGHLECCTRPALHMLADKLPEVPVHVMTNFLPPEARRIRGGGVRRGGPQPLEGLDRPLSEEEAAEACQLAADLGLRVAE